ncbi:hypothetical protein [Kitasatospora sp. HPMI-4]|uniref:hypothetical protein n=1 Tax=Kitasatospora sp. HPMI-4 TaxID=3448443 RepID=UPI003F1D3092
MPGYTRPPSLAPPARATALGVLGVLAVLVTAGCGSTALQLSAAPTGSAAPRPAAVPAGSAVPRPAAAPADSASPAAAVAPAGATASVRLSAAQLPNGAAEGWQPLAPPRSQAAAGDIQLNECASVAGATTWQQQGFISVYRTPAEQDLFTFPDGSAAQAAYQRVLAQMDGCQSQSRALQANALGTADAQVTRTAVTGQGAAWSRQWTGVEGLSAPGPQTDHLYAVQQGADLAVVHYDEWPGAHAAPYDTRSDGALLTAVAQQLG